ncbi:MAG: hypothetical protein AAFO75_14420, partial [Pseudomonadota bacterium]
MKQLPTEPASPDNTGGSIAEGAVRLREDIQKIRAIALQPVATALALQTNLGAATQKVLELNLKHYDADKHREAAPSLMQDIFALQQDLRTSIATWHEAGLVSPANQRATRNLLRMTRYAADILGELWIGFAKLEDGEQT